MHYISEISENLDMVNELFDKLGTSHLLENADFFIDSMSMESWLKVNLRNNEQNKIPLSLTFSLGGLEIRLDRISEAISWTNENLKKSNSWIMLKNILTSYILVKYYGKSQTYISLFGRDGKCTNEFKFIEGFSLNRKRQIRLYQPIFYPLH
jgi:hypothetical protein